LQVNQSGPAGKVLTPGRRCVSIDGDADRVIYYFTSERGFHLLDGDRIATLVAGYLKQLLAGAGLAKEVELGLVQTAYANGSSTAYITGQLGVPVAFTPTGVKHLHHKAAEFGIGVYFEANGHGTIVFSEQAEKLIRAHGGEKLTALLDVVNQTVGDAISDMLVVECVLADRDWSCADWLACYVDLPNRLGKVAVRDRTEVTTTDAERKVVTPAGLQAGIDSIVARYQSGRSFVRPRWVVMFCLYGRGLD
jgi:phosphoacetylglucosamine mutase